MKCCSCCSREFPTIQKMEERLNRFIRNFDEQDFHFKAPTESRAPLEMHFYPKERKERSRSLPAGWVSKKNYNKFIINYFY